MSSLHRARAAIAAYQMPAQSDLGPDCQMEGHESACLAR